MIAHAAASVVFAPPHHTLLPRSRAERCGLGCVRVPPRDRFENGTSHFLFFRSNVYCVKNIACMCLSSGRSPHCFAEELMFSAHYVNPYSSRVKARTRIAAAVTPTCNWFSIFRSTFSPLLANLNSPSGPIHLPLPPPRTITVGDRGEDVVVPTSDDCDQSCRLSLSRQDLFVCKCRVFTRDGQ